MLILNNILRPRGSQNDLRKGYCKRKVTDAQGVTGVYGISLILFDVWTGDDCCTSCVSTIIKQKDFVTFPVSDSAMHGPLGKRLIPPQPNPSGPPRICCVY